MTGRDQNCPLLCTFIHHILLCKSTECGTLRAGKFNSLCTFSLFSSQFLSLLGVQLEEKRRQYNYHDLYHNYQHHELPYRLAAASIMSAAMSLSLWSRWSAKTSSGQCNSRMNDCSASSFHSMSSDVAHPLLDSNIGQWTSCNSRCLTIAG